MDPKLLQAAGIDPKMLGLEAKAPAVPTSASADPKSLFGMDAKALQAAGIDPKLLQGLDPKALASLDPKMMAGLAGIDPKLLFGGMDPKLFGFDPKMFGLPDTTKGSSKAGSIPTMPNMPVPATSIAGGLDPRLLGLDLKMLQGLDSKALQSLGLDPKLVTSLMDQTKQTKTASLTNAKTATTTPTFSSLDARTATSVADTKTTSANA